MAKSENTNKIGSEADKQIIEPIKINHENLVRAFTGMENLAKQVGFLAKDGSPNFDPEVSSLTPEQETLVDYVLALDLTGLVADTDRIIAEADKLAPHILDPYYLPTKQNQNTFKDIAALANPLGYVEESGRSGIVRDQAAINAVMKFTNEKDVRGAWPVDLLKYYETERRIYNTLEALQKAKLRKDKAVISGNENEASEAVIEINKQAAQLFGYISIARPLYAAELTARPFISSDEPVISTKTYTSGDFSEESLKHFVPEKFYRGNEFGDITRAENVIVGGKYFSHPSVNEMEAELNIDKNVKEFVKHSANQNNFTWGGLMWLQFEYLPKNCTLPSADDTSSFFIITPLLDGALEFRTIYKLTNLQDMDKTQEQGAPVSIDIGKGLILDTTYTISAKHENNEGVNFSLKSHTAHVLDEKVYQYAPGLNIDKLPNIEKPVEEKLADESAVNANSIAAKPARTFGQTLKRVAVPLALTLLFLGAAAAAYFVLPAAFVGLAILFAAAAVITGVSTIAEAVTTPKRTNEVSSAVEVDTSNTSAVGTPVVAPVSVESLKVIPRSSSATALLAFDEATHAEMAKAEAVLTKVDLKELERFLNELYKRLKTNDIRMYSPDQAGILGEIKELLTDHSEANGKPVDIIHDVLAPMGYEFIKNGRDEQLSLLMHCVEAYLAPRGSEQFDNLVSDLNAFRSGKLKQEDIGLNKSNKSKFKGLVEKTGRDRQEEADIQDITSTSSPTIGTK